MGEKGDAHSKRAEELDKLADTARDYGERNGIPPENTDERFFRRKASQEKGLAEGANE